MSRKPRGRRQFGTVRKAPVKRSFTPYQAAKLSPQVERSDGYGPPTEAQLEYLSLLGFAGHPPTNRIGASHLVNILKKRRPP